MSVADLTFPDMLTGSGDKPTLHHPWRAFRELVDWTLRWAHLPDDAWGQTCFDTRTVTLSPDLNQAERRCTIAHETQHILRGPTMPGRESWEEHLVDRNAARLLLPDIHAIGDALAWAGWHDVHAAADELWVDEFMLRARLNYLHPSEKGYLRARFADDARGRGV
jgi:hypothetical protein